MDNRNSPFLTIFTVVGAAAIDPIWKINHLYSTELFPTVVRNMARGVCNVGSRIGSLIGPQVSYLSTFFFPLPYMIFGIFSFFHVAVCFFLLPETKHHPLPDSFNDPHLKKSSLKKAEQHETCLEDMKLPENGDVSKFENDPNISDSDL